MNYRFNCFRHDFRYNKGIKMKLKVLFVFLALMFSGCAQMDGVYGVGKTAYTVGKKVAPAVPLSEETRTALIAVDGVATKYDTVRESVREGKTADANTTSASEE